MSVVITCFEAPSDTDLSVDARPGDQLLRALAPDAPFRYITIGAAEPRPRATGDVRVVSGAYEVCHRRDEPAPAYAGDVRPVTFVNCMVVTPGDEDAAFAVWREVNAYMVTKPGYRWHRLHRPVTPDAPFGLVNVARWQSAEAWSAAHDDGFRALAVRPDLPFRPVPTLCELVGDPELAPVGA
jgi:hypothetical protein